MSARIRLWFYLLATAIRNLRRGGQRIFVANLCIAFGVMSLVAMSLLADVIARPLLVEAQSALGGDLSLYLSEGGGVQPEHFQALDELVKAGLIAAYTPVANNFTLTFRKPDSGRLYFASNGIGINPEAYPLVGRLTVGAPANTGLSTLLQNTGDVLVTGDLAIQYDLAVGDPLYLTDLEVGVPLEAHITGIVTDSPDHGGGRFYYTLATAAALYPGPDTIDRVLLTLPANGIGQPATIERLKRAGWDYTPAERIAANNRETQDLFTLLIKGAGILGLLVGGIGIANTMQVLLARRTKEVAIYKALGYTQADIMALFLLETFLLGVAGSLLGLAAGILVEYGLVSLFSRVINLLLDVSVSPGPLIVGPLIGVATTVLFALIAIVRSSNASPAALLRNERIRVEKLGRWKLAGLVIGLALPFSLMTGAVMGSYLQGLEVILFALAGLCVLGGLLAGVMWLVTRLLPSARLVLVNMARNNLRRRGWGLVFPMIALFTGVVTLSLAAVVTQAGQQEMDEHTLNLPGPNLTLIAPAGQEAALRQALAAYPVQQVTTGYEAPVRSLAVDSPDDRRRFLAPRLIGRQELADFRVQGAPWGSAVQGVYTWDLANMSAGSQITVTLMDGSQRVLPVVGSYEANAALPNFDNRYGLLMDVDLLQTMEEPEMVRLFVEAPAGRLGLMSDELGIDLPQVLVVNHLEYLGRYTSTYHNLFVFALAMAGLALAAGVLLVANAVSLAMIDRRYEIGVLKAVGYSRSQVLRTLVVEYTLVALIAGLFGVIATQLFLLVLSLKNDLAGRLLQLSWPTAGGVILLCFGLTLVVVLGVTWQPTRVSPGVVLNDRI